MPPGTHDPYAAFRVAGFRRYLYGRVGLAVGTHVQEIAVGWEMYQRTGEALALGMVGLVQALPWMVLALPAGYLADRFDRRRVALLSLTGATLTSLGLAALSIAEGPVEAMYALLLLDAVSNVLGSPARTALLPQIVPRQVFHNAVTWNSSMWQLTSVLGPAAGGLVIVWSVPAAYLCAAAGSLVFIFMFGRIRLQRDDRAAAPTSAAMILGGVRYIWRSRLVLSAVSLDMFAVLFGGAVYLLPIFAKDILEVGAEGLGWLRAAPAAGAFCMAILLAHLPPMRKSGRNLLWCVAGFGMATIIFGLSTSLWLSLAMLFLTGAFDQVSMVIRHTLVQLLTPDEMRGRVTAVNSVFISASNNLGGMESGLVAHWFGPVFSVVSGGIGSILVVALTAAASSRLRRFGSLRDVQSERHPVS